MSEVIRKSKIFVITGASLSDDDRLLGRRGLSAGADEGGGWGGVRSAVAVPGGCGRCAGQCCAATPQ